MFQADLPDRKIGDFDSELVEDFWQAVAANALCNLHVVLHHGRNSHHIAEAIFKAAARALRMAVDRDERVQRRAQHQGRAVVASQRPWLKKARSTKLVSTRPSTNSECAITLLWNGTVV